MYTPKKILIDLGKLKNRFTGLGETSYTFGKTLSENISLLKKENFDVYLLVPKKYIGTFGNEIKYIPLNFFRRHLPFLNKEYHLWFAIHQDSGYMPSNKKTKYLLTIHDLNFMFKVNKNKVHKRLSALQKKIDRASSVIAISNFTKNEIEKHLHTAKTPVKIIYPGVVDTSLCRAEPATELRGEKNFFFHISAIVPKKNVMVLIDIMKIMPEKKLVLAGSWDNNYAKKVLQRIKDEKILNVITLSKISNEQKAWLYQNCEAVFFPSYHEGFGLPVIEAMYCGKPVFLSTYTSLPETGSDKAFYWDNFDPQYMKDIVNTKMNISNDKLSNELKQYAKRFSLQNNFNSYIALFKELLS